MSTCIDCHSTNAELFRGDDGHYRVRCPDCGYTSDPFVSNQSPSRREQDTDTDTDTQPSLSAYSNN